MITLKNTNATSLLFSLIQTNHGKLLLQWITNWTVAHYLYMWYLLNEYYLCLHFEPEFYNHIFPQGNKYFHKFWSEILKNDAHDGEWVKYHKIEHPRFGHKVTSACLVTKLHSKNNIRAQGIFHPAEMYQVTNSDGTLHTHLDVSGVSCYHALTMAESLNKGIFPEIIPTAWMFVSNNGHMKIIGKCQIL